MTKNKRAKWLLDGWEYYCYKDFGGDSNRLLLLQKAQSHTLFSVGIDLKYGSLIDMRRTHNCVIDWISLSDDKTGDKK